MTVKFNHGQLFLPSASTTSSNLSPPIFFPYLFFFIFQTSFYKKLKKPIEIFLQFSFRPFDFKLPVLRTINFANLFEFKLDSRFDSNFLVFWTLNFDSLLDYKFGIFSTFLFAVSLSNWILPRPSVYSIPVLCTRPWVLSILVFGQQYFILLSALVLQFSLPIFKKVENKIFLKFSENSTVHLSNLFTLKVLVPFPLSPLLQFLL